MRFKVVVVVNNKMKTKKINNIQPNLSLIAFGLSVKSTHLDYRNKIFFV